MLGSSANRMARPTFLPTMSNTSTAPVREVPDVDPRVARSTHALARALIDLIQERDFSAITVQNILDRAGVGRATFYAHYRNKQDVLHSSVDTLFASLDTMLDRQPGARHRLFPVHELLTHMAGMQAFVDALRASGQFDQLWSLFADHAARTIERRLTPVPPGRAASPVLVAHMLAGALGQSVQWWLDHEA